MQCQMEEKGYGKSLIKEKVVKVKGNPAETRYYKMAINSTYKQNNTHHIIANRALVNQSNI